MLRETGTVIRQTGSDSSLRIPANRAGTAGILTATSTGEHISFGGSRRQFALRKSLDYEPKAEQPQQDGNRHGKVGDDTQLPIPANPIKAIDRMPARISVTAAP